MTELGLPRNYVTQEKARVQSEKDVSVDKMRSLLELAFKRLRVDKVFRSKALLNGIVVELVTNCAHQYDFWTQNWWMAPNEVLPHGRVYSAIGVNGMEPSAHYCPDINAAVFFNTEYYGQCKSWTLGLAAAILEKKFNTHSLHAACVDVNGKGVAMIAPTGTGKTTQAFKLFKLPEAKILGDDWLYVEHAQFEEKAQLIGRQPEKSLYMRTEIEEVEPWIRPIFEKISMENVVVERGQGECHALYCEGWCYHCFGNSRAMVKREDLLGAEKVADETILKLVVLLEETTLAQRKLFFPPKKLFKFSEQAST